MAAVYRIPFFLLSFSSNHCRKPFFYNNRQQQFCGSDSSLRKKHGSICLACAVERTRVRKKAKNKEELRSEIMEFIALAGLPEDHVPSMKELTDNGRKDLANIVRRRGYKFIGELLADSKMEAVNVEQSTANAHEEGVLTGQGERTHDVGEEESSSSGFSSMEIYLPEENFNTNLSGGADEHWGETKEESSGIEVTGEMTSNGLEIDNDMRGSLSPMLDESPNCSDKESDDVSMTKDDDDDASLSENVDTHEHYTSPVLNYGNQVEVGIIQDDVANDGYGVLDDKDKRLGFSSVPLDIEEQAIRFVQNGYLDDDYENSISEESLQETNDRNGDERNKTRSRENQAEINDLMFKLHQKELELSRLKEQIENEKKALSDLQRKAEIEINNAQKLILEKDAELQAAEESLSGLQEVEIEYCGDGNVAEVTGSFNGWQHRIEMELQPSKSIGKSKCWLTLLWLYPGKYEIKFIVDGKWIVDPRKESVTKGHITNNVLKVDVSD